MKKIRVFAGLCTVSETGSGLVNTRFFVLFRGVKSGLLFVVVGGEHGVDRVAQGAGFGEQAGVAVFGNLGKGFFDLGECAAQVVERFGFGLGAQVFGDGFAEVFSEFGE